MKFWEINAQLREPSGGLGFDQKVGPCRKCAKLLLSAGGIQVKGESLFSAVVPPIQQTTVLVRVTVHGYAWRAVAEPDNISPGFGEQFSGKASRVVGKVKNAKAL
jgi:hypothetical protein